MKTKNIVLVLAATLPALIHAQEPLQADPAHIELFNARNFCVLCNFNEALLSPETLYSAAHSNANISGTYVYDTIMDKLDLTFAFMYAIKGERFSITNSKVKLINLSYSDLPYFTFTNNQGELVNFTGSGLDYGNFRYAHLDYPIFTETALEATDFTGAQFKNAYFINTRMFYTNFTDTYLVGADFTNANIKEVNFTRANLLNAKITQEQLANANVCDAILPDGSRGECEV